MADRKYRQRGYQDSERERPARAPQGPRPQREGPRGRGLGAPAEAVFRCADCGRPQAVATAMSPSATCSHCGSDLHTCSNCLHFDTSLPKECRQPVPERVAKKRARNECTFFSPKEVQEFGQEPTRASDDPRAAFDALFKI